MNMIANPLDRRIRELCFLVLLTALALVSGALAKPSSGGGGGRTSFTNVTSTIFDACVHSVPAIQEDL